MCYSKGDDERLRAVGATNAVVTAQVISAHADFATAMKLALTLALCACTAAAVSPGDKIEGVLDFGFPPEKIDLAKRLAGKKVILVGLPGAFTPT